MDFRSDHSQVKALIYRRLSLGIYDKSVALNSDKNR